ncbi:MAG: dolichyl-phosphate beta-glucosyltransferase [Dehalococcoidia bacterium]
MSMESRSAPAPRLSLVMPAYNEERRLGPSLEQLLAFAVAQGYPVEILVVDDGSVDRTAELAREAAGAVPANVSLRLLQHPRNLGKGRAVRTGCLAAAGDFVAYLDADLATPPQEALKLLRALEEGADVAVGSRVHPGGYDMRVSQPPYRRALGWLYTWVRQRLLLPDIVDTQCPLKAFRREAAQRIFARQRLSGWAFDVEVLYLARRMGLRTSQVPVEWHHVGGSQMRVGPLQALRVLWDLLRLRWLHRGVTA